MRYTAIQNLPCPDDTDMAAVALYMQCLAEQIEAELLEASTSFTGFLDAPVAIWTTGSPQALIDQTFLTFSSVTSNNWPTVPVASAPALPNLRGWYYIGANANILDNPAVADQDRSLILRATQNTGVIFGDGALAAFQDTVLDSNTTAGENVLPAGTVFFAGGDFTAPNPVDLTLQYRSGVGPANVVDTTLTPAVRLWVIYLGDTPQIGAA